MMENWPLDTEQVARADAHQCGANPTFIDFLPIELLERSLEVGIHYRRLPYAVVKHPYRGRDRIPGKSAAKIKTLPLEITVFTPPGPEHDTEWMQLLVNHAHRWRSISFDKYFREMIAILDSSPPTLEILSLTFATIPPDCKLFSPGSTHLRKLTLTVVDLPKNFDPPFELEELYLSNIFEPYESSTYVCISMQRLHRFLQASPGLRSLALDGPCNKFPGDNERPPVNLPKLQDVQISCPSCSSIIRLFRAEHCTQVKFDLRSSIERPPLMAWATLVHALKRAEELKIIVRDTSLCIQSKPNTVGLTFQFVGAEYGDSKRLACSILEDILNETERDSPLSARIELTLLTIYQRNGDFDVAIEILKLLQPTISEPSSGLTRWRLPYLDTLRIPDDGRPDKPFQVFVQARSNRGDSSQTPRAVAIIRAHRDEVTSEY
ncbi:hypothetical protein FRC05_005151 [Tulasnella sp. 425]|nr:hypothetical protein FRC05_005151 [Tulasnella sp. 425]